MSIHPYRFTTRLNSFRGGATKRLSVSDALSAVAKVPGLTAVELDSPQDFESGDPSPIDVASGPGLKATALALRRRHGVEIVIATAGSGGAIAACEGGAFHQPVLPATLVATVGASDALLGACVAA
jgi:hypothetical protein